MATNIYLEGSDMWGQFRTYRIYKDNGRLCVALRRPGSLRRDLVPYKAFASKALRFSYLIERS